MSIAGEDAPVQNTLNGGSIHSTIPTSSSAVEPVRTPSPSSVQAKRVTNWNATDVGLRLGADAASAASASILIAPIVTVIDRSIVQKASTGTPFRNALSHSLQPLLQAPHRFLISKPFLLIFTLYTSTYFTANAIDTLTSTLHAQPAATVTTGPTKFVATSAVNMSLCVYKDSCFARMFGGGTVTSNPTAATVSQIPKITYLLFALRDSLTIFASFNLPPLIGPHLSPDHLPPILRTHLAGLRLLSTDSARNNTAQFLAPALMQLFSTPIHLLGLDMFNRQGRKLGVRERVGRVRRDWAVSALARMGRIVPAFGVGGVVNAGVRRGLHGEG